jgi:copper chaperone
MKTIAISVENLKCHGCANTITKGLMNFQEVKNVDVDVPNSSVEITFDGEDEYINNFKTKLSRLGYPESGHNNTFSVAKSFVSCAVGRINK